MDAVEEPECSESQEATWLPIPRISLAESFTAGEWRTASLDGCAARVDATGQRGYVVHGQPGAANDPRIALVVGHDGILYLQSVRACYERMLRGRHQAAVRTCELLDRFARTLRALPECHGVDVQGLRR